MSNIHRSQFLYHEDFIGIFREVKTWEQKTQVVPFIVPSRILDSGTYLTFTLAILVLFFLDLVKNVKIAARSLTKRYQFT